MERDGIEGVEGGPEGDRLGHVAQHENEGMWAVGCGRSRQRRPELVPDDIPERESLTDCLLCRDGRSARASFAPAYDAR